MAFFRRSKGGKSPGDLVRATKDSITALERAHGNQKTVDKASEEFSKNIQAMRLVLSNDPAAEVTAEARQLLFTEICATDLIPLMITHLGEFEFEAKKDVVVVFQNLLRRQLNGRCPTVEYVCRNTSILDSLMTGYEDPEIAFQCGFMLRECIRHESLAKILIYSPNFYHFFSLVEVSNFDVASDAFVTFKDLLTTHKALAADFLEKNYEKVFEMYTKLLTSPNYVTRRQSLKMLGELLLDRSNFGVMTRYISDADNLKLMMMMLRDKSKSIQFEAFHVFKVFVANPNKTEPILHILVRNKKKLIVFLNQFHNDKDEEQFNEEKAYLLRQIEELEEEPK
mmetsp:Transcript_31628/g.79323  ORF Transcript_31628/g.79323 Transcript_31628/m.79323 type:complete len:339 (+) Transcript_31628:194-1210(+)|eukprot:CAMPEP_0174232640 /NCGR_PEP_ID=MMETSP0417-20130205/2866_1 /TAXON_ID=242541 /ORGANISM="Mayorella sp, Strain BSH-02190019" /LENGTH=338 /DNA_ID=CAMNT_0015310721 /DNA_START=182 /DNA_END=1198 /DNA_ORIENTATION=-